MINDVKQFKTNNSKEQNKFPLMVRLDEKTKDFLTEFANDFPMSRGTAARYILRESLRKIHNERSKKNLVGII